MDDVTQEQIAAAEAHSNDLYWAMERGHDTKPIFARIYLAMQSARPQSPALPSEGVDAKIAAFRKLLEASDHPFFVELLDEITDALTQSPAVAETVCRHTGEKGCKEHNLHCGWPKCQVPIAAMNRREPE